MRQRLSWDKDKVAEIEKTADPYTMNQDRKNPPIEKYRTGDPSSWAEDPHMATPWKTEGRTETGHPAPAREAVVAARKMEDRALKCITIAQRMLPGAVDDVIEKQATELMYLPDQYILATLQRQSELAETLAGGKEAQEEEEKPEEEEKKEAQEEEKPEEEEKKEAQEKPEEEEEEKKEAQKKEDTPEEEKKEAGKEMKEEEEKPEEEEKKEAKKEETPEEEKKEAAEADLLDKIFENSEMIIDAGTPKTGAKSLTGMVKKASSGLGELNNLWEAPPDVSDVFGR